MEEVTNILDRLESGQTLFKCPYSGKPAAAVLTVCKPGEQSVFCVRCLIDNSKVLDRKKKDLIILEDLVDRSKDIIQRMKHETPAIVKEEAKKQFNDALSTLKQNILEQVSKQFDEIVEESLKDSVKYIDEQVFLEERINEEQEAEKNQIASLELSGLPDDLKKLVSFYLFNLVDRKYLLKENLVKFKLNLDQNKSYFDNLKKKLKSIISGVNSEFLYNNRLIRKFIAHTDIINRGLGLQPLYQYQAGGNLSLSIMTDKKSNFYGFSNYLGGVNTPVLYTISQGDVKTLTTVILSYETTLHTHQDANIIDESQTPQTSAEVFDQPIVLEADTWYNISMSPINAQPFMICWGNAAAQPNNANAQFNLPDGGFVFVKGAADDNCGNSTYAHIYADLYIH